MLNVIFLNNMIKNRFDKHTLNNLLFIINNEGITLPNIHNINNYTKHVINHVKVFLKFIQIIKIYLSII